MAISGKEVKYIAELARLELGEEEVSLFTSQLGQILGHAQKIAEVDVGDAVPTSHVLSVKNVFRKDETLESVTQEEAVSNAPKKEQGAFVVPKIV